MTEAQLIDKMEKALYSKLGRDVLIYKVYSCGYTKTGFPDLILMYKGKSIFVEAKKDTTGKSAIKALRASQKGMHKAINAADIPVYILFDGGLVCVQNDTVSEYLDETPFSCIIKELTNGNKLSGKNN